jgi:tetratricopeptide (TPR) repeat protein
MKSNSSLLPVAGVLFAGLIAISGTNSANAQSLDPHTGMPVFEKRGTAHFDPASGLPGSDSTNAVQTERANILEIGAIHAEHGVVSLPATGLPQYAGDHSRAENWLALASETPTEMIRYMSPFAQVPILTAKGQYDQALRVILDLCDYLPSFPLVNTVLPDWIELARIYPPARQSMIEIRDRDTREFEQAKNFTNVVGLFMEASQLNNALGETNATYAMCQHLEQHNPAQFQACFFLMEPLLMQHGDYQLCLKNIGDPQANLEMLRTNLEFMRKVLPLWRENQIKSRQQTEKSLNKARQFAQAQADQWQQFAQELQAQKQQFRQDMWAKLRTNTPDADEMPLSPPPNYLPVPTTMSPHFVHNWQLPPDIDSGLAVTNFFVGRVCVMVDILVAAGQRDEAEKIRDEAVTTLDDERLRSAISNAEQKIKK